MSDRCIIYGTDLKKILKKIVSKIMLKSEKNNNKKKT